MGDQGDRNAAILARIPAGHWGKPEEIRGAVYFWRRRQPITSTTWCCRSMAAAGQMSELKVAELKVAEWSEDDSPVSRSAEV